MKRIAIIGGGIAGLSAAYELSLQKEAGAPVEFDLFETGPRLGGIVETIEHDGFVIECGPDSWVTEKPWAHELAVELGLEPEILHSNDHQRKTYIAENRRLTPMPDGMRMMVPLDMGALAASPLFSESAKAAYMREPARAAELKAAALDRDPARDESVWDFVVHHFGEEVAENIAAPLLAGVFGGNIRTLSARAVLPAYVALEREHGSLILGLQQKASANSAPVFTTLRGGLGHLIARMEARIPPASLHRNIAVSDIEKSTVGWRIFSAGTGAAPASGEFNAVLLATPADVTGHLLAPIENGLADLLPRETSSAIVVALAFSPAQAAQMQIPKGFGFLVPQRDNSATTSNSSALLACTFVHQKFPHRAPKGAALLRVFFGGQDAPVLLEKNDAALVELARNALTPFLGKLPEPKITVVRRLPDSLPQYAVGHLDRIAQLESRVARLPYLRLLGNAYHGVGLPDLIRDGRNTAREMVASVRN
jgi:oxygen-dependent protoporphyrinogen oxidase